MTRFARAEGSKASNARTPEDATSWSDMKQQMKESHERKGVADYRDLCSEDKPHKKRKVEWEEFDVPQKKKGKSKSTEGTRGQKHGRKTEQKSVVPDEATDMQRQESSQDTKSQIQSKLVQLSQTPKAPKAKKNGRKKPVENKCVIDGREIEVEMFDHFPVKKEDAIRLRELRKKMIGKGIPKAEIARAMKLERRRAEKALNRERKKNCFHCRGSGHLMSECPKLDEGMCDVCYKCGSTEHMSSQCQVSSGSNYKYGKCFVCGEQGHISRQCPDNPRGLYPQGGSCKVCGDVTHLKKDCPQLAEERAEQVITLKTASGGSLEGLGDDKPSKIKKQSKRLNKVVKF